MLDVPCRAHRISNAVCNFGVNVLMSSFSFSTLPTLLLFFKPNRRQVACSIVFVSLRSSLDSPRNPKGLDKLIPQLAAGTEQAAHTNSMRREQQHCCL